MGPFWEYWYFHIPNYVFAALIYTFLGRFLLALFVPPEWDNYIWRNFCRLTNPVLYTIAAITPRMIPGLIVILLAAFWLFLIRTLFYILMAQAGLVPLPGVS